MIVASGQTDVTTYFVLRDSSTHAPKTDVTITDLDLYYVRDGQALSSKADAIALAAADSAHAENQAFNVGQGLYRIDWPDAAFVGAAGTRVHLIVVCAGVDTTYYEQELSPSVLSATGTDAPLGLTLSASPDDGRWSIGSDDALGFSTFTSPTGAYAIRRTSQDYWRLHGSGVVLAQSQISVLAGAWPVFTPTLSVRLDGGTGNYFATSVHWGGEVEMVVDGDDYLLTGPDGTVYRFYFDGIWLCEVDSGDVTLFSSASDSLLSAWTNVLSVYQPAVTRIRQPSTVEEYATGLAPPTPSQIETELAAGVALPATVNGYASGQTPEERIIGLRLIVTDGTPAPSPSLAGDYWPSGDVLNGQPVWQRTDGAYFRWYSGGGTLWYIAATAGAGAPRWIGSTEYGTYTLEAEPGSQVSVAAGTRSPINALAGSVPATTDDYEALPTAGTLQNAAAFTGAFPRAALVNAPTGTPNTTSVVDTGPVEDGTIVAYQHGAFRNANASPILITVTDADGIAIDLSAKTLEMTVYPLGHPETISWRWTLSDALAVTGAEHNVISLDADSTHTAASGTFRYVVWDKTTATKPVEVARGELHVLAEAAPAAAT